jgi:two-component system, OmpR family, alkaline phosphatase synthesis response regulator PhoP
MKKFPSGVKHPHDAIEIQLWEIYLVRNRHHLYHTLSAYCLERKQHPQRQPESSKVSFHFMMYDWERTIRQLLTDNSIPFEITSTYKTDIYIQMEKKKVYVAEDDLNILFALNTMLEDAGYDVLISHCGAPMLKASLPSTDLFILDNRMPDIDGIEVCRHLKSQPETMHVPVIMISAVPEIKSKAMKAGVDAFLGKPFEMHALLELVAKHTSSPRQDPVAV